MPPVPGRPGMEEEGESSQAKDPKRKSLKYFFACAAFCDVVFACAALYDCIHCMILAMAVLIGVLHRVSLWQL